MPTIVDLSHPIDEQITMFPGLPAPGISEFMSREESKAHYSGGTTFAIHRYELIGNSGTYLDAPFHRFADRDDLASLPLESCVNLDAVVLDVHERVARGQLALNTSDIAELDLAGRALLIRTGWDSHWGTDRYLDSNPFVTEEAGQVLVEKNVRLVGIDSWNIDDVNDGRRPVHSDLLRAGIPIIENLCGLDQLPAQGFRFHAAPLPIRSGSAIPIRAYVVIDRKTE